MSFFFLSDASAKESTEIKVFDPNLKMSDQEMLDLLKEVDLESHGYKKEKTTKLACVASVSSRVIARKLEREEKELKGEGEGRRGNACPQTPRFWKTPLDISRFGSFVNWQLVKIDNEWLPDLKNLLCSLKHPPHGIESNVSA